jgi:hypothetical protein
MRMPGQHIFSDKRQRPFKDNKIKIRLEFNPLIPLFKIFEEIASDNKIKLEMRIFLLIFLEKGVSGNHFDLVYFNRVYFYFLLELLGIYIFSQ